MNKNFVLAGRFDYRTSVKKMGDYITLGKNIFDFLPEIAEKQVEFAACRAHLNRAIRRGNHKKPSLLKVFYVL